MNHLRTWRNWKAYGLIMIAFVFAFGVLFASNASAQTSISTGSIQGVITDATGASVPNAEVTITDTATGQTVKVQSTSTGAYNSGSLIPGEYTVSIAAKGFKTTRTTVTVQVGVTASGNAKLEVGETTAVVEVTSSAVTVNTEQATIQGVLNQQQIENLPINGRNFLDLAQLEPGVQIQDGANFDPTKVGFSSISFGGRAGRTARIEVDGVDISDETVGTTTENIPAGSIQEFQVSQSTLDPSTELTSSGSVNVVTRSGSNGFHGDGFGLFRDSRVGSAQPGPFQRNQMGIGAGGPMIKNKLFFFGDYERIKQDQLAPVSVGAPFDDLSGGFTAPFRENDVDGRMDYSGPHGLRMFYKFSYFGNLAVVGSGVGFRPFEDKNYTRSHTVGADFNTGEYTHSFRFAYLKFENDLRDAVRGTTLPFNSFPISVDIGSLNVGPNPLAPQETPQSDHELKYDGSRVWGSHIFRYGVAYNHLQGGGFASFFKNAPQDTTGSAVYICADGSSTGSNTTCKDGSTPTPSANSPSALFINALLAAGNGFTCPNGDTGSNCILNYPVGSVITGNGLGFSSERPAFGFPAGGLGPDNRIGLYFADSWKVKPNLTLTLGLRYDRDTGRTDSDLNDPLLKATLDPLEPGLGNPVRQPNANFGPNLAIAWDPFSHGTTVIRLGGGIYYENGIWNNVLFDRPSRIANGSFLLFPHMCSGTNSGTPTPVQFPNGVVTPGAGTCRDASGNRIAIGAAANAIEAFQQQFQTASAGASIPNAGYIPTVVAGGSSISTGPFAPNFQTPRSVQMNVGIQHQLRRGLVLNVDYLRNVATHYLLSVDLNHSGDVRFFDKNAALAAISATNSSFGCTGTDSASIDCAITAGAAITDYAGNGLDSASDLGIGACALNGITTGCAFPGKNANFGSAAFLEPIGRSVYNGLDIKLVENVNAPFHGIRHSAFQFAYSLSRFENAGTGDQDFITNAVDNANPLQFFGPSSLDRKNQFSFGGTFDLPLHFKLSTIAHFYSPLPLTLTVPFQTGTGEIFQTDFTGDGTGGDILPGTNVGSFARSVTPGNLNNVIGKYNSSVAGQATPAGGVLISNGLFTLSQLQQLGGVAPSLLPAPAGQVNMDWLRAFDVKLAWDYKVKEWLTIEPTFAAYNVLNFANFNSPTSEMSGTLDGSVGSANGTTYANQDPQRVGLGTGTFAFGAPRIVEFGLRLQF